MDIYEMVYQRLRDDETLAGMLAVYNGYPAVFYQRAAPAADKGWESPVQYPRVDYIIDMMENPARNASGTLSVNACCDTQIGAEPEDIEKRLKELLHVAFANTEDYVYVFGWARSDAFEIKKEAEETARTIGVTVTFDIIACPTQYTLYPDPVKAVNQWTKKVIPDAFVIGEDTAVTEDGWIVPTKEAPVIYWQIIQQTVTEQHFAYSWLGIVLDGHVYAQSSADRLYNLTKLNAEASLIGHMEMEDGSPLLIRGYKHQPHMDYLKTGQIQINGMFGVLTRDYPGSPSDMAKPKIDTINASYVEDDGGSVIHTLGSTDESGSQTTT